MRLRDIWFRYEPGSRWTLSDIAADIPAGTRTALVGETGSGKTTLAYLVARLYEPERGCVSIDGTDIRDVTLGSLAATVGLVSQETYLFHASIRENLRFACPEASDEEIEDAARAAQIHELISSLPDGYDTPVGERGYRFSGGEKQRMAIARTVLRNPPVLILDEATSALDNETERAVQQALDELARGRTTIAIAHRLSTIRDADQILVLDAGQIVERGTHDELVELGGRYAALLRGAGARPSGAARTAARRRGGSLRRSVDVQAHVVDDDRLAERGEHIVHVAVAQLLGQLLHVRPEHDRREELARVLGLLGRRLQPALGLDEAGREYAARVNA